MAAKPDNFLKLRTEELEQAVVVHVNGSVSFHDADKLQSLLVELTGRKIPRIVLDLSGMDYICSSGLGAIITAHVKSHRYGGQLSLMNPQPAVRQLLETTRLTKLFTLHESLQEALQP